jgi:pimeloyl-ACP methyl ester carboxylesterase
VSCTVTQRVLSGRAHRPRLPRCPARGYHRVGHPQAREADRLAGIVQPTFVANGDNDEMMHTKNSHLLAERLPNAHVRIYPDANHGFLYQYPELFADHVRRFLNELP